ncbi:NAD(P)H-binding protein [Spiractinospora alimapuensis]|nr:NAD(P)H-binding protein [Spiractinospora alimapuensis]
MVTGSTGNIGKRVVAGLVGAGQRVRAMTRDPVAATAKLPAGVEVIHGDFERPETWADALNGVERVYLFSYVDPAPSSGPGFIETAVEASVCRFVVHSAAAAGFEYQGDPEDTTLSAFRRHLAEEREFHRGIERAVEASGAQWTHIRMGLLAAGSDWAEAVRTTGTVRAPFPRSGSSLVHEADVAEIAVAALLTDEHLGAAYTLTGPEMVTQEDQVRAISEAIGKEVTLVELTPEEARTEWHDPAEGMDHEIIDWILEQLEASVRYPGPVPPTDTFERLTGRPPRSFTQWARDHAEDFR